MIDSDSFCRLPAAEWHKEYPWTWNTWHFHRLQKCVQLVFCCPTRVFTTISVVTHLSRFRFKLCLVFSQPAGNSTCSCSMQTVHRGYFCNFKLLESSTLDSLNKQLNSINYICWLIKAQEKPLKIICCPVFQLIMTYPNSLAFLSNCSHHKANNLKQLSLDIFL